MKRRDLNRNLPAPVVADKLGHLRREELQSAAQDRLAELTDQQRSFAIEYATHGDAIRAAEAAGGIVARPPIRRRSRAPSRLRPRGSCQAFRGSPWC